MKKIVIIISFILALLICAHGQNATPDDETAIRKTALNYIEGWYEGDAGRMESALYPKLAKRIIFTDPKTGHSQFRSSLCPRGSRPC